MAQNPFYYNLPTTPEDFVGRWALVDEVVADLSKPVPDSWAVIGGRRFGKSSVLNAIESRLLEQLAACTRGQRHILPLLVDLKGCEMKTVESVYACFVRRLHEVLDNRSPLAIDLSKAGLRTAHEAESLSFTKLERTLKQLVRYFSKHHGPLRLVLLLDEVETATRFLWCETLFDKLRYLASNASLANTVKLVLTGSARVMQSRQTGSPLLNIVKIKYMNLFSASDLKRLMARGGQLPDEAATSVQTTSGGHPFMAQYLLHHLWDPHNGLAQTTLVQLEIHADEMLQERDADMSGWWEAIGESGRSIYAILAKQEEWIDGRTLRKQFDRTNLDRGLAALRYHGLVIRNESWPRQYRVAGSLFRTWYLRNIVEAKDTDNKEEEKEMMEQKQTAEPFKLHITRQAGDQSKIRVRALATPMGEPHATSQLPYSPTDLITVLKALELGRYHPSRFIPSEIQLLQNLGLLRHARFVHDLRDRVGRELYQTLFPKEVGAAFKMAFNQARTQRQAVALQLRFDDNAVQLARYPWELLHDGQRQLLSGGAVELTRYMAYPEAALPLPVAAPWRLLYIAARPGDLQSLPAEKERLAVWNSLQSLSDNGQLTLDRLDPPTYDALLEQMDVPNYHLIHFDGHGVFARRCPTCDTMHYPDVTTCQSCALPLDDVPPQGYLAFENSAADADYVSTEEMENLLLGSQVRLVLLSACQSAVVQGESLFGGLAPGLIRAGVPAIVAMQFSVPVKAAIEFAKGFYGALARGESLPRAVALGRRRLFRSKTSFIPTLYLRSTDDEGRLFVGGP
ncbi:MAG: CHAT domain-containing protein [Ardenticatenaceae bacterium]